jgi:hypothetical protein
LGNAAVVPVGEQRLRLSALLDDQRSRGERATLGSPGVVSSASGAAESPPDADGRINGYGVAATRVVVERRRCTAADSADVIPYDLSLQRRTATSARFRASEIWTRRSSACLLELVK